MHIMIVTVAMKNLKNLDWERNEKNLQIDRLKLILHDKVDRAFFFPFLVRRNINISVSGP